MGAPMKKGKVYLIGAGPGDPGLITLKGIDCIKESDVIVYDYLTNEKFLTYAKPGATAIYVGKKGGEHTLPQEQINELLITKAKEDKIVARLKGGDPFVFGRGGEEAEALVSAGISFEVVPGVSSGIAVPAYAGIPLSHRDYTSTVAFITGRRDPTKIETSIAWDKLATGAGTLVFMMGVRTLPEIVENLIKYGRDPKTPVAVIRWGTRVDQETLVGTLDGIVHLAKERDLLPPALTIVGDVVRLRDKLNWFEKKPLFGKRIMITRAREQAKEFAQLLESCGAEVIQFPTIEVVPPRSWKEADNAIKKLSGFDWLIFTSVNGVRFFTERLRKNKKDLRALEGIRICAIGPRTAEEIERLGISPDFVPAEYRAEAILRGLKRVKGARVLIPRAKVAREILPEELIKKGAKVKVVPVYRNVKPKADLQKVMALLSEGKISTITFTSSSTVKNFVELLEGENYLKVLDRVRIACIGPVTAKTAEELGIKTHIMPKKYTIPALTEAIVEYWAGSKFKG